MKKYVVDFTTHHTATVFAENEEKAVDYAYLIPLDITYVCGGDYEGVQEEGADEDE